MRNEQLLFGKGSPIESGKDAILKAVLESEVTAIKKVAALVLAMNDSGFHQLVQYFMLINQAVIESTSPVIHS